MMDHDVRTEGGSRLYSDSDLQRLRLIRYARQLGSTLGAIHELLSTRIDPEHRTCQESKGIVQARLNEVEVWAKELQAVRRSLQRLNDTYYGTMHSSVYCSILEALERDASDGDMERWFLHHVGLHSRGIHTCIEVYMNRYQHIKGQIKDDAIEALPHDPLPKQYVKKSKRGRGNYQCKDKHAGRINRKAGGK